MELTSLNGNITTMEGESYLHLHASFGRSNGEMLGGHLYKAYISATSEIFIHTIDDEIDRAKDPTTGLNVLHFE